MESTVLERVFAGKRIPCNFGPTCGDEWSDVISAFVQQFTNGDIEFHNGISKCALVIKGENQVIKIPFNGHYYGWEDDNDFCSYCYANDLRVKGARDWDYCENELLKYKDAVNAGFGDFFAYTEYCTEIDNTPIYAQEKCIAISSGGSAKTEISDHACEIYDSNHDYDYERLNADWVCAAIDWYGEEEVLHFIYYLEEHNIYDLHDGNVGFSAIDGRPVLIDWAGWRD